MPPRRDKCINIQCGQDKICNPETGRCVSKEGAIGRRLINQNPRTISQPGLRRPPSPPQPRLRRSPPEQAPPRRDKCINIECGRDKICNPETGRCVSKEGAIGRRLINQNPGSWVPDYV